MKHFFLLLILAIPFGCSLIKSVQQKKPEVKISEVRIEYNKPDGTVEVLKDVDVQGALIIADSLHQLEISAALLKQDSINEVDREACASYIDSLVRVIEGKDKEIETIESMGDKGLKSTKIRK